MTSPIQEPNQRDLNRAKDAPRVLITCESTRVSRALCQELGTETNIIFYYLTIAY